MHKLVLITQVIHTGPKIRNNEYWQGKFSTVFPPQYGGLGLIYPHQEKIIESVHVIVYFC